MGTVFLGQASPDSRLVAVKVIRPDLADDTEFRRRFRSEVARAQQVPPFCTAEVIEADPDHEPPYLVVEYVDGPSLASVVAERGPLTAANLHGLAVGVAAALTAIHGAGVIHRDLKPGNVLLAPGSPKVIDFGIARGTTATVAGQTQTGQMIGTVAYMAPERFGPDGDKSITPAADVFSWAAVVAFAGTGRTPFRGETPPVVAMQILNEAPDLYGLTGSLRSLVEQALDKDPARRPTARELLDRLLSTGPAPAPGLAAELAQQPELMAAVGHRPAAGAGAVPARASLPTAPVLPPVTPGRWGRIAAIAATISVVVLTAIVLGLVSGLIALPGILASGQQPPGSPSPSAVPPPTSAAPSPTPTASPSAAPSPTPTAPPSVRPSAPPGFQTVVEDTLAAPGALWKNITDDAQQATCLLEGGLQVTRQTAGSYRCRGVDTTLTDFDADVDVTVRAGSCAGIWFRFQDLKGYALRICRDRYELVTHGTPTSSTVTVLRTVPLGVALPADSATRVGISARGSTYVFTRRGREVFRWTDATFAQGKLILGIFQTVPATAPYKVTFANIRITAPVP